jgi:hypothetical protein
LDPLLGGRFGRALSRVFGEDLLSVRQPAHRHEYSDSAGMKSELQVPVPTRCGRPFHPGCNSLPAQHGRN